MRNETKEFRELKIDIGKYLKKMREEAGFESAFKAGNELDMGYDAIYKIERGEHVPTKRLLNSLIQAYKLHESEIKEITEKCERARALRSKITKQQSKRV